MNCNFCGKEAEGVTNNAPDNAKVMICDKCIAKAKTRLDNDTSGEKIIALFEDQPLSAA